MFEFIRKHLKVFMIAFFPLVILAFVFVGIDTSFLTQRSPVVARVAGVDITQNEWDFAHRQYADRLRAENRELTSAMLDSPQVRYSVLEQLVRDQVLAAAVRDRHYAVSDAEVARALRSQPDIAALIGDDGRLDMEGYRNLLAQYGLTPQQYENSVRQRIALQRVLGVVQESTVTAPTQAKLATQTLFQRRTASIKRFAPQAFEAQVQVDDAALQAYYETNQGQFQRPDVVDVEYAVLDLDAVMQDIQISEDELREYYDQNRQSYAQSQERRHARHILFATDPAASASEREAARKKAEAALAQLREDPSRFAEIAREQSDDTGSAADGGDLGFFERGAMVADFDNAVFSMQPQQISDIVATEYGFHIIQLLDIEPAVVPSFEEIHDRLLQDVRNNLARNRFIEQVDTLRNLAHEQPDSLQPVADTLGLTLRTATAVPRTPGKDDDVPQALNHPAVLAALFDPRATENGENIDPVDIGGNTVVTARVTAFHPAQTLPFEQVRDEVQKLYVAQKAAELAAAAGERALAQWQADADAIEADAQVTISRQDPQGLSAQQLTEVMTLPQDTLPQVVGFVQDDGSYLLVKVTGIAAMFDEDMTEELRTMLTNAYQAQLQQVLAAAETDAYYETLKQSYKVQIRVPRPE
ncbi:hypothetical protein AAV94_06655 [Lampropedia cohaerens]|uniref:Periplasmic chaperone PpiD n=1 Tax=Lampropedia cohaerens TaxID=1610491 RepID=A0A0U1Q054_9BURK|nr:SurA N-terminal domain-containing protein [Lampropedia cohaerens]KKW68143.1 hypothetical protein AAV94_06655 [Lampropedia cohaerens]